MALPTVNSSLPMNGYGSISITTTSVAVSTLTAGPSSNAYPTGELPNQALTFTNVGTAVAYVCPFGGTCTSSVGIPLAVAETKTINLGGSTVAPTVISGSAARIVVAW